MINNSSVLLYQKPLLIKVMLQTAIDLRMYVNDCVYVYVWMW